MTALPKKNPEVARDLDEGGVVRRSLTNPEDSNLMEILDRVLDHGIVIEPSSRIRLVGLELRKAQERLVIDWRHTYF